MKKTAKIQAIFSFPDVFLEKRMVNIGTSQIKIVPTKIIRTAKVEESIYIVFNVVFVTLIELFSKTNKISKSPKFIFIKSCAFVLLYCVRFFSTI